jgi:hypothetical protein
MSCPSRTEADDDSLVSMVTSSRKRSAILGSENERIRVSEIQYFRGQTEVFAVGEDGSISSNWRTFGPPVRRLRFSYLRERHSQFCVH